MLILDEPTRGIDVAAKAEIQSAVLDLARKGMSIVFISSEMEEVLRISHRVLVMRDRSQAAVLDNSEGTLTQAEVVGVIADGGTQS